MKFSSKNKFAGKISDKQASVAADIVSGDSSLSTDAILERHGVTTAEYASWLQDGYYTEYLLYLSDCAVQAEEPHILRSLVDMSKNKDIKAIKLFFDLRSKKKNDDCFYNDFGGIQAQIFDEDFDDKFPSDD